MSDLSVKEMDLLNRIRQKPKLQPLFFRRVKGLKWFEPLQDEGYFDASNLPAPAKSEKEGYVRIPSWPPLDYLVKTAPELRGSVAEKYAPRFLEIISRSTLYAKEHGFGNYHAWWQFSLVLNEIPWNYVQPDFLEVIDYWFEDQYETSLVAESIGEKWLPKLLKQESEGALALAKDVLAILFRIKFFARESGSVNRPEAIFRFDSYRADKIIKNIAYLAGQRIGGDAISLFCSNLEVILDELKNDSWSAIWQPAIEDHEQNEYHDDAENLVVTALRDSLKGFSDTDPNKAREFISRFLSSRYQTISRIAIYCVTQSKNRYRDLWDILIADGFLQTNFRHEIWHFLNVNYDSFSDEQKEKLLKIIQLKTRTDEDGNVLEDASSFEKATWLAAIKHSGERERALYAEAIKVIQIEPDHPDFSSYSSSGWVVPKSPYSVKELGQLTIDDLVKVLERNHEAPAWNEPGIKGLYKALKQIVVAAPLSYYSHLHRFTGLDLAYIYAFIEGYRELWEEKSKLPWGDIWPHLLTFMSAVVTQERFWDEENSRERKEFIANRFWVVGAISRLLETGAKSDDHAFEKKNHRSVENIIDVMLKNEKGESFKEDSDAVFIAINSPRGKCIEALINLTLRECRLEDLESGQRQHPVAWTHFQSYYDAELRRSEQREYEFATLVTNYLPNFLYMSKGWVIKNLAQIFNHDNYLAWLCSMQGYAYVGPVYQEIYEYLKNNGHFFRALDDEKLRERVEEKVIQNVVVAFINDFESFNGKDSLISGLIRRRDFNELQHLIWFVWTLRKEDDEKLTNKVFEMWPDLLGALDLTSEDGQKLASHLCRWAVFVEKIDPARKALLLAIAPFANVSFNTHELLESLARISDNQPFEANEIWKAMLVDATIDYPEEAIRAILSNLVAQGQDGIRAARETVSVYIEKGFERPSMWLLEISKGRG